MLAIFIHLEYSNTHNVVCTFMYLLKGSTVHINSMVSAVRPLPTYMMFGSST